MASVNLKDAGTLKRLAGLPFYGQAEAVVRLVDPLWKVELPALFTVKLEHLEIVTHEICPHCGSDNGEWEASQTKSVKIEACSVREAEEIAEKENAGWCAVDVKTPRPCGATVPPEFLN